MVLSSLFRSTYSSVEKTLERFQEANISEHERFGGGSIMAWAGISTDGRTHLHSVVRGVMTGVCYRDKTMDVCAGAIGSQFIFMDDNARPYRARMVEDCLQQETIIRVDWPARSPDLNPIDHIWNLLQLAILRRPVQPRTLMELGNALKEVWNISEMAAIQRLIGSMRRCCQAVLGSRGSHTSY